MRNFRNGILASAALVAVGVTAGCGTAATTAKPVTTKAVPSSASRTPLAPSPASSTLSRAEPQTGGPHRAAPAKGKPVPKPAFVPGMPAGVPMPRRSLTPGEAFAGVTVVQVCRSGWASAHRQVSDGLRARVYAAYGVADTPGTYEVDHLISLELGGDNSIRNLWPERNDHPSGALNTKDLLENRLHTLVCAGRMGLHTAQTLISTNWWAAYKTYGGAHYGGSAATAAPAPMRTLPSTSSSRSVHPGAFCTPTGASGRSSTGKAEVCGRASDGRDRWHAR
jgi:hypothetical protein